MRMSRIGVAALATLCVLTGCTHTYTVQFEVDKVINARPGDEVGRQLDVDILTIGPDKLKEHPELSRVVNRSMNSEEWFDARRAKSGVFGLVGPDNIYALRSGGPESYDSFQRSPLVSLQTSNGQQPGPITVKFENAADDRYVVIYGDFYQATQPVVFMNPKNKATLKVLVGREGLAKGAGE